MGQEHPPSTYAHDAKWCILGIWLSTMIYQFYEAAKAGREEMVALPKWIHLWLRSVDMHRLCLLFVSSPKIWAWVQPSDMSSAAVCSAGLCRALFREAWKSTMWGDFGLAFAISVDSVVLGWVVIMFQSRCLVG